MVDPDTEERSVGGSPLCNKILGLTNGELNFHLGGLSNLETPPIHAQDGVATADAKKTSFCFGDSSGISLRLETQVLAEEMPLAPTIEVDEWYFSPVLEGEAWTRTVGKIPACGILKCGLLVYNPVIPDTKATMRLGIKGKGTPRMVVSLPIPIDPIMCEMFQRSRTIMILIPSDLPKNTHTTKASKSLV